jgi:hypothetical protein
LETLSAGVGSCLPAKEDAHTQCYDDDRRGTADREGARPALGFRCPDNPEGALQQQVSAVRRTVDEGLRRHFVELRDLVTARRAPSEMRFELGDLVGFEHTENVGAQLRLIVFHSGHRATSVSLLDIVALRARNA